MTGYVTKVEKNGDEEMIQVRLDESGNFVTLTKNDIVEFHRGVNQDLIRNQYPLVVDYARLDLLYFVDLNLINQNDSTVSRVPFR